MMFSGTKSFLSLFSMNIKLLIWKITIFVKLLNETLHSYWAYYIIWCQFSLEKVYVELKLSEILKSSRKQKIHQSNSKGLQTKTGLIFHEIYYIVTQKHDKSLNKNIFPICHWNILLRATTIGKSISPWKFVFLLNEMSTKIFIHNLLYTPSH